MASSDLHVTVPPPREWAVDKLHQMTLDEKIAQLMMLCVPANYPKADMEKLAWVVERYHPGGVCVFQGSPVRQVQWVNRLQSISPVPLLVAIDGEWGPSMRLDSCPVFPRQMTLGALPSTADTLIFDMGAEIGRECRLLGIHLNFAPCVDVNNNERNPVIHSRSFGQLPREVARKATLYMQGMQSRNVAACAKHFPGHGDTETDSHLSLPSIHKSRADLNQTELPPFKTLIAEGVEMVMVSHLNVPALDTNANAIATLSYPIITQLLREDMMYDGLVITDAMGMKGLRTDYPAGGEAEIRALLAGCDILLCPEDLTAVIPAIRQAVETGILPQELIDERCLRVLRFKASKGLTRFSPLPVAHLYDSLNTPHAKTLIREISQKAITLLKNEPGILPLLPDSNTAIAVFGGNMDSADYLPITKTYGLPIITLPRVIPEKDTLFLQQLSKYKQIIAIVQGNQNPKNNFGIHAGIPVLIDKLAKKRQVILCCFALPYALSCFQSLEQIPVCVMGYQSTPDALRGCLDALFGKMPFEGHLPVSVQKIPFGTGIQIHANKKTLVQNLKISSISPLYEKKIDSLVKDCIGQRIFPGCQIIAMQKGNIVFYATYGSATYEDENAVNEQSLYDLASLTKVTAVLPALMKLYEAGEFQLHSHIGDFLPYLTETDKADLTIAELLTHTSGLPAYIPFYKELVSNKKWLTNYLSYVQTEQYTIPVAKDLYLDKHFPDTIRKRIAHCRLGDKAYKYSDLGFILLKDMVERLTGQSLENYTEQHFYRPLGMTLTGFNPWRKNDELFNVMPTEHDTYFRMQTLRGYVHDQTAALFGGVCGHAGLFSTAHELSVFFEMLRQGGTYKGHRFFAESTVKKFTATYPLHHCKRRSLGFDTPNFEQKSSILPQCASRHTYGHQGFTGTVVWYDPDQDLLYIFLSNRVYPDAEPNRLSRARTRLLIHEWIYQALNEM
jgi:beta-glucosidase-like glycosyl hydrolase/CubicO group peptidase (beta-lactamase class C family)